MCTLTVVPLPDGSVRLAFNRDERRTRPAALAPQRAQIGQRLALFPTDLPSGGTWFAVNDAGLALAILNVTPREPLPSTAPAPRRSRGEVIPALLGCASPAEALGTIGSRLDYADFAPFRLVLVGEGVAAEVRWDGLRAMVMTRLLGHTPLLYTSSGLGDHTVEGVRRELFDSFFDSPAEEWLLSQDAFHRHQWPGREHLSVNMARASARTVSHARIVLGQCEATLAYHPDAPALREMRTSESEAVQLTLAYSNAELEVT